MALIVTVLVNQIYIMDSYRNAASYVKCNDFIPRALYWGRKKIVAECLVLLWSFLEYHSGVRRML